MPSSIKEEERVVLKEAPERGASELMNIDKVNVQRDEPSAVLFHVCRIPLRHLLGCLLFSTALYYFVVTAGYGALL